VRIRQRAHARNTEAPGLPGIWADGGDCPGSPTPPSEPAATERRRAHHADLELALGLDGQQRSEQRHAAHEVVGAIDRVDIPACVRLPALRPVLLADHAVFRMDRGDPLAEPAFDGPVHLGDERAVRLGLDHHVALERSQRHGVRLVAAVEREGQPGIEPRGVDGFAHERIRSPAGS
jgi:hypothetical protein